MELLGAVVRLALILVGAGLAVSGCDELRLGRRASPEPVEASLEDLEAGRAPPDLHLRLGPHLRVYSHVECSHLKDPNGLQDRTRVVFVHYPIVSLAHPYARSRDTEDLSRLAVLVRDTSFERFGEIPKRDVQAQSVEGLLITDVVRWDDERRAEFKKLFPGLDLDRVLVLEKDRRPQPPGRGALRLGGGILLALLGLLGPAALRRLRRTDRVDSGP